MIRKPAQMDKEAREKMRGGAGKVEIRHFFKKEEFGAKARLCAQLTLQPGCSIGAHQHENEDEVYLIVGGAGVLDDGKTKTPVSQGDAILTRHGESHSIANNGAEALEIIAMIMQYA